MCMKRNKVNELYAESLTEGVLMLDFTPFLQLK